MAAEVRPVPRGHWTPVASTPAGASPGRKGSGWTWAVGSSRVSAAACRERVSSGTAPRQPVPPVVDAEDCMPSLSGQAARQESRTPAGAPGRQGAAPPARAHGGAPVRRCLGLWGPGRRAGHGAAEGPGTAAEGGLHPTHPSPGRGARGRSLLLRERHATPRHTPPRLPRPWPPHAQWTAVDSVCPGQGWPSHQVVGWAADSCRCRGCLVETRRKCESGQSCPWERERHGQRP